MESVRPLIGVNLLYVRPGYQGGTVRYAHELLKHIIRLDRYRWMLYVQREGFPLVEEAWADIPRREIKIIGRLFGRVAIEHAVLPRIAQRDGVDLMFSPGFVSPLWGRFCKVVTIHDLYYWRFPRFVRPWQRRYWRIFVPVSLRQVDAAIVVSETTSGDICEAFPWARNKVRRIYPGADALESGAGVHAKDRPFCLMVGNLTPNKNVETVVAAFLDLKARGIDYRLVIAGRDLFGILADTLSRTKVRPNIELAENVDDVTLAFLYSNAACLIHPAHYEGFGLPVIEAMNSGCPVVASDIKVMREVGGTAALYFQPNSPNALADAIEKLVPDQDRRSGMAAAGRANSARFRWEETARETAQLFDSVLGLVE